MFKLQALGNLKSILCPSASLQGAVMHGLRSLWAYNFNHIPHSSHVRIKYHIHYMLATLTLQALTYPLIHMCIWSVHSPDAIYYTI